MIKKFLKIKSKYRYIGGAVFLAIVYLIFALIFNKGADPVTDTVTVPAGQTTFSYGLDIDEKEPYAGIEFALSLSDESVVDFASFTANLNGATASPFISKDGLHYFGFYTLTGSNTFPTDETMVGTLDFTDYTSDQAVTVTIVQMKVIRVDENKQSVTTEKESPSHVITVLRETNE